MFFDLLILFKTAPLRASSSVDFALLSVYFSNHFSIFLNIGAPVDGAGGETRTPDLRFTKPLLYQLSYSSVIVSIIYILVLVNYILSIIDNHRKSIPRFQDSSYIYHRLDWVG